MVSSIAISRDGKYVASSSDTLVKVWDYKTGALLHCFEGHKDDVLALAFDAEIVGDEDIVAVVTKSIFTIDLQEVLLDHGKSIVAKGVLSDIRRSSEDTYEVAFGPTLFGRPIYYRLVATQEQVDSLRSIRTDSYFGGYVVAVDVSNVWRPLFSVQGYVIEDGLESMPEVEIDDAQTFVVVGRLLAFEYFDNLPAF